MSLLGSESHGGSISNSAQTAQSQSQSNTFGQAASQWSAQQAREAREWQEKMFEKEMAFNAAEAQKARDWNAQMANTIYTRSVDNMREAGINPILAANMGLSGASVSSGATASTSAPGGFMGSSYADQHSASSSQSSGESHGSSWQESTSGLATALEQMGGLISGVIQGLNAATQIDINLGALGDLIGESNKKSSNTQLVDDVQGLKDVAQGNKSLGRYILDLSKSFLNPFNGPTANTIRNQNNNISKYKNNVGSGKNIFKN